MTEKQNSVVSIFNTHTEAEDAVRELQKSGFDMKKLSIVGKDYHSEEHVVGYYNIGGPPVTWIIGALEGAAVIGGLSAVGATLFSIGIPKDSVLKYETSVHNG